MESKISFESLFDGNLKSEVDKLTASTTAFKNEMISLLEQVKSIGAGIQQMPGGGDNTKKIEKLYETYKELGLGVEYCERNLEGLMATQDRLNKALRLNEVASNAQADSIARMKAQAELAKLALEGMGKAERYFSEEGNNLAEVVGVLTTQVSNFSKETKRGNTSLASSYSTLDDLIKKTKVNINGLLQTERQLDIATKNGIAANESLSGSYNQLYAQYNLVKNVLNAMSDEMRNDVEVGKVWEAQALAMMDKMKELQEATGKHTLSVGDYTKATNGLNLAMAQVVREAPTLANSLNQFAVAISNNIPILMDNIRAYATANREAKNRLKELQAQGYSTQVALQMMGSQAKNLTSVFKALGRSLLSINTIVVAATLAFELIAKAIDKKRRAAKEAQQATEELITTEKLLTDTQLNTAKAMANESSKLSLLIKLLGSDNRKRRERIDIAKILKNEYADELANYTAEEIAMGKANKTLEELNKTILEQAKAKALANAYGQMSVDLALKQAKLDKEREKRAKEQSVYEGFWETTRGGGRNLTVGEKERKAQLKTIADIDSGIADLEKEIGSLAESMKVIEDEVNVGGLIGTMLAGKGNGGKVKEVVNQDMKYIRESITENLKTMEEGLAKDIALTENSYDNRILQYKDYLAEQMSLDASQRQITEEGIKAINNIITALETEKGNAVLAIRQKYDDKYQQELEKEHERELKATMQSLALELDTRDSQAKAHYKNRQNQHKALLANEIWYWTEYARILEEKGELSLEEEKNIKAKVEALSEELARIVPKNLFEALGMIVDEQYKQEFVSGLQSAFSTAFQYANEWIAKQQEMADAAAESAKSQVESAKDALELEMQARANGYANNVELARKEYEEKLALEKAAMVESQKYAKMQEDLDTAQQISSLLTATANIWASMTKGNVLGIVLATAATGAMWSSFLATKNQAYSALKTKTYGEGMSEYLDYGGSHASGHDIDFGTMKDGTRRRVEKGEVVGVINKRNVQKYGAKNVENIIDSLNKGTFEKTYTHIAQSAENNALANMYALAFSGINGTDLHNVEKGINTLISQGEVRVVPTPYGRIEYRGNNKRIIRNS